MLHILLIALFSALELVRELLHFLLESVGQLFDALKKDLSSFGILKWRSLSNFVDNIQSQSHVIHGVLDNVQVRVVVALADSRHLGPMEGE